MIVFCSFQQMQMVIDLGKKHGFNHYIPLVFIKNFSAQVLKANMKIVGETEYALVLYREKLPKFRWINIKDTPDYCPNCGAFMKGARKYESKDKT